MERRSWPPHPSPNESDIERTHRLQQEQEAKRISDEIDNAIELERGERRKRRSESKVLLLGQAESGKSTILKNIFLHFAPQKFQDEVDAWCAVIHLNLVRSVNFILEFIPSSSTGVSTPNHDEEKPLPVIASGDVLRRLKIRLSPLRNVEEILATRLSASVKPTHRHDQAPDVSIRSGSKWKSVIRLASPTRRQSYFSSNTDDLADSRRVIEACKDDIMELWSNSAVRAGLKKENIQLQEQSGFFLGEVSRIASQNYQPTHNDVLRARLQTMGVEEHHIPLETGDPGAEWTVYDVGGSRGQRAAWAPYFDDVNAIIFLAPVSSFDQTLQEDPSTNRLMDTFAIWKSICSSKILATVQIILLLNKCDLLDAKLKSGVQFSKYVTSYANQPNDFEHVSKYLSGKFASLHKQYAPRPRKIHTHLTCAIVSTPIPQPSISDGPFKQDSKATSSVLGRIQESVLVRNLKRSDFV